jgi:hypothetical protein
VLNERGGVDPGRAERIRVEGSAEETALVDVRGRLEQHGPGDARNRVDVHKASLPAAAPMLARSRRARD